MSEKVKRGLGLLVVAVIGYLTVLALLQVPADNLAGQVVVIGGLLVAGVAMLGGAIAGLVLLAWGLLRD